MILHKVERYELRIAHNLVNNRSYKNIIQKIEKIKTSDRLAILQRSKIKALYKKKLKHITFMALPFREYCVYHLEV